MIWLIGVVTIFLVVSNVALWYVVVTLTHSQTAVLADLRTELVDGEPTALRREAHRNPEREAADVVGFDD